MSLGLLGAYDSSSDSESSEQEESEVKKTCSEGLSNPFKASMSSTLPSFMVETTDFQKEAPTVGNSSSNSVFNNPFRTKENKKKAILEQHVTMTTRQEEQKTIEGKKVCWNFRKGRCRFGHKCTFAHDSDVKIAKQVQNTSDSSQVGKKVLFNALSTSQVGEGHFEEEVNEGFKKKKRPGLSEGIVPSKKAMKFHNNVYNKP